MRAQLRPSFILALVFATGLIGPTALAAPAESAPGTLAVEFTAVERDTYKITIRPAASAPAADPRAESDNTRVTVTSSGRIVAARKDAGAADAAVLWSGHVERIDGYGRERVPGLALCWQARDGEAVYGLGERFNSLDQAGRRCAMWIVDAPGAQLDYGDSYFCTPVLYSSAGYALFATDNPEGEFDLNSMGDGWHRYRRAGAELTFYLTFADSLKELLLRRARSQGPFRGLPDWAWGPWISRNSYETQAEAVDAIEGMVRRGWPVAAIVQEAWKGLSETGDFNNFSSERWPDVDGYFDLCRRHGIRTVLWQVPVIHPSTPGFADLAARGHFVRDTDGRPRLRDNFMVGFANIDFTNPDAVAFWKDQLRDELRRGVAGIKADDGEDIHADDVFHDGRRGWQMHNEYSTLYNRALVELFEEEKVDGLLWARSGSLGVERLPALWAGDQLPQWKQYRSLVPAGLSAGLSGAPFWSHDIGGYAGKPTPELYIRWLQFGAFSPLMQYHGVTPREPWFFGETAEQAYGLLVNLRMALKPTLIALGREAAATGMPIMRPMSLEYPHDSRFVREDTQYMLGPDLLVAPVLEEGATGRRVLFPEGRWQHLIQPIAYDGPGEYDVPLPLVSAPVFVREGAKLAVQSKGDALPLEWEPNAPMCEVEFASDRPLIRNARLTLRPSVLKRRARVQFEAAARVAAKLNVRCGKPGGLATMTPVVLERQDETCAFALPVESDAELAGREQRFEVRFKNNEADTLVFHGSVRWIVPVQLDVEAGQQTLVAPGRQTVKAQVRNECVEPITITLRASADPPLTIAEPNQTCTLAPAERQELIWAVESPEVEQHSSLNLRIEATVDGAPVGSGTHWFAPPWRWVVAGPFPARPRAAYHTPFAPEWITAADAAFETPGGPVRWRQLEQQSTLEAPGVDFGATFGLQNYRAAYALTRLRVDAAQEAILHCGSDDTLQVWHNDALVFSAETYRAARPDQERIPLHLTHGVNTLMFKVGQEIGSWRFLARLSGPQGETLRGVCDGFDDYEAFAPERAELKDVVPVLRAIEWRLSDPLDPNGSADQDMLHAADSAKLDPAAFAGWKPTDGVFGPVNLNAIFGAQRDKIVYAVAELTSERERSIEFVAGSDDGLTLWLTGKRLIDAASPRAFRPDSDRVRVTVPAGRSLLLARITQGGGDWLFQVVPWDVSQRPHRVWQPAASTADLTRDRGER